MKIDVSNVLAIAQKKDLKVELNEKDERLREQTDAFESLIIKSLLDIGLKMDNPLYPKEAGNEIYQSMYKDTLASQLSGGFGYSQMLFDYLKEKQAGKR